MMPRISATPKPDSVPQKRLTVTCGARALGALSAASGMALIAAPRATSQLYGLPPGRLWNRLLGTRDVTIGAALFTDQWRRVGLQARAWSDAFDGVLILARSVASRKPLAPTLIRVAIAFGTSYLSTRLARNRRWWQ